LHGQLEGRGRADCLDRDVRAEAPGYVLDDGDRVLAAVVDGDVGAEALSGLEPRIGQVDRDDVAGAEQPRAGDRGQADRSGPNDGDHVARPYTAGEDADLV